MSPFFYLHLGGRRAKKVRFAAQRLFRFQCRFNVMSKEAGCPNERYLLYKEWAHPKSFYKMQPLDLIR